MPVVSAEAVAEIFTKDEQLGYDLGRADFYIMNN
jgi:hypothetical protein